MRFLLTRFFFGLRALLCCPVLFSLAAQNSIARARVSALAQRNT
jgi:hypothetical protein